MKTPERKAYYLINPRYNLLPICKLQPKRHHIVNKSQTHQKTCLPQHTTASSRSAPPQPHSTSTTTYPQTTAAFPSRAPAAQPTDANGANGANGATDATDATPVDHTPDGAVSHPPTAILDSAAAKNAIAAVAG